MIMNQENLASVLKAYRMENLLTQKELAEIVGASSATIINIEKGEKVRDLTIAKIRKALDTTIIRPSSGDCNG